MIELIEIMLLHQIYLKSSWMLDFYKKGNTIWIWGPIELISK